MIRCIVFSVLGVGYGGNRDFLRMVIENKGWHWKKKRQKTKGRFISFPFGFWCKRKY